MNPDALIARTNLQRLEEGKRFDAYYLTTLSADAAPSSSTRSPRYPGIVLSLRPT
jgi:hypothetical protein